MKQIMKKKYYKVNTINTNIFGQNEQIAKICYFIGLSNSDFDITRRSIPNKEEAN